MPQPGHDTVLDQSEVSEGAMTTTHTGPDWAALGGNWVERCEALQQELARVTALLKASDHDGEHLAKEREAERIEAWKIADAYAKRGVELDQAQQRTEKAGRALAQAEALLSHMYWIHNPEHASTVHEDRDTPCQQCVTIMALVNRPVEPEAPPDA